MHFKDEAARNTEFAAMSEGTKSAFRNQLRRDYQIVGAVEICPVVAAWFMTVSSPPHASQISFGR